MSHNEPLSNCKNIDELLFPPENDPDREEFCMTRTELEQITEAFKKDEGFRKLFVEYVEEMQDPETQATYQREMRQLEYERGNIMHFINPVPGYVLKSSVNGEKKGFINVCSNPIIRKASFQNDDRGGSTWSIPYAQSPPREDVDKSGSFCLVYDVIFNPETVALARKDKILKEKLEQTAMESVENSFNVKLDKNNVKRPKLKYKGLARATAIKYKIGGSLPAVIDPIAAKNELPPQRMNPTPKNTPNTSSSSAPEALKEKNRKVSSPMAIPGGEKKKSSSSSRKGLSRSMSDGNEGDDDESWTEPRYSIKYRSHVDMQDFTLDNHRKATGAPMSKTTPDELILTVDLPLLRDSSTLDADVVENGIFFELKSELRARYKLKLKLPYQVHGDSAKATFDKDKRKLTVIMKTIPKKPTVVSTSQEGKEKEGFFLKRESESSQKSGAYGDGDDGASGDGSGSLPNLEKPIEVISNWTNDASIKGILKRSGRIRSLSESFVDKLSILRSRKDDSISLESLNEEVESDEVLSASPTHEKSVRFSDSVQRQLYRSNSSILGQKKKNQRKNKNKRKSRERANSEGSASSLDVDADDEDHGYTSSSSIALHHPITRNASSLLKNRDRDCDSTATGHGHESPLSSSVDD